MQFDAGRLVDQCDELRCIRRVAHGTGRDDTQGAGLVGLRETYQLGNGLAARLHCRLREARSCLADTRADPSFNGLCEQCLDTVGCVAAAGDE